MSDSSTVGELPQHWTRPLICTPRKAGVIGICGPKGSGKSTFARYLADIAIPMATDHRQSAVVIPFALPVKQAALGLGWDGKKDERGRRLLQILGTDIGRNLIDPNIWANRWCDSAEAHPARWVIADDTRFANEVSVMRTLARAAGCPCVIVELTGRTEYTNEHASEAGVDRHLVDVAIDSSDWDGDARMAEAADQLLSLMRR